MLNLFNPRSHKPTVPQINVKQYIDCYETIKVLVRYTQPKFLCDIGASDGSWGHTLSLLDPKLRHIVSFEPRREAFAALQKRKIKGVRRKNYPFGLGNKKSRKYVRGGTTSASFFQEKDQQLFFPKSLSDDKEAAQIFRLDDIYRTYKLPFPDCIKIDVQGYEQYVLEGGTSILTHAKFLVIELSFREFYKNQPTLSSTLKLLESHEFELIDFGFQWRSKEGELIQIDGIFRNRNVI